MKLCASIVLVFMTATSAHAQITTRRVVRPLGAPRIVVSPESNQALQPAMLSLTATSVATFDYGDYALKQFDLTTGALLFHTGRTGGGPGEFANPTALQRDAGQSLWINDPEQPRVSIYSNAGKLQRGFRPSSPCTRFVLDGKGFIGFNCESHILATVFDSAGNRISDLPAPAWTRQLDAYALSSVTASGPDGWAAGFDYLGRILVRAKGTAAPAELSVIETRPALKDTVFSPRPGMTVRKPNPKAVTLLRSLSYANGHVYALMGSADKNMSGRYVDVYDVRSRAYAYSYLLPRKAQTIAVNALGIAVIEEIDDVPAISFYAFTTQPKPAGVK